MKVFKFGGASLHDAESIRALGPILEKYRDEPLLIIVSAMGKTTNALEKVAEHFYAGSKEEALRLFHQIKQHHLTTLKYLVNIYWQRVEAQLMDFFTEVEWLLHDKPVRKFDYYYDQIVCCGELLSSAMVNAYLQELKFASRWLDVRDVCRTDDRFREATIDWNDTTTAAKEQLLPLFGTNNFIVTQGFIGATDQNESTTLGREGSDYTGAVFANILDAESLTIWKDVQGILNADPKLFPDAHYIEALSYREVIEMAYYGAQVIHPKTIKPLQNKQIPLYVKCFTLPDAPGTVIRQQAPHALPPMIILKKNQVLLELSSRDFSFVEDTLAVRLHELLQANHLRPGLTQNGAIGLLCCLDDQEEKIAQLALQASEWFDVQLRKGLTLLTIRHYNSAVTEQLMAGKHLLLRQQTEDTLQALLSE